MAVNKVVINDKTAIDLTGDTVTPSDLVEGVTAHDATGMQITGTRPATSGTDTSDATATEEDIARNKTAYVQGKKITGKLYEYVKGEKLEMWVSAGGSQYLIVNKRGYICISMPHELNDEILRIGCTIELGADPSLFGDAVAADVCGAAVFPSAVAANLLIQVPLTLGSGSLPSPLPLSFRFSVRGCAASTFISPVSPAAEGEAASGAAAVG